MNESMMIYIRVSQTSRHLRGDRICRVWFIRFRNLHF